EYLCAKHGWVHGSLADYAPRGRFDLVVCHDVLQYLDDRTASRSLARLAGLAGGVLYFSALTRHDARHVADRARSDFDVHLRTGDWYRRRLRRGFRHLGLGLHLSREMAPVEWELEKPWR
ncbi:MAG: class I SAM-dependent methyltransferase, partial [Pseudomonadota bacterium]